MGDAQPQISRGSTAMRRSKWSRPVALALEHGVLGQDQTFLDYGCGHGNDFRGLRELGFDAVGWDPAHLPDGDRRESDIVNLGFVLNTIERIEERGQVLRRAHKLTRKVLVVSVRVDRSLKHAERYADGVLTNRNTYQKLYSQAEFREYVAEILGVEPVMADLGIAYVFRDETERARYLATTTFRRRMAFDVGVHERFRANNMAQRLITLTTELGRLPAGEEFAEWSELASHFGGVARVGRLVLAAVDAEAFTGSLRERAEDILTFLAKLRFSGMRVPKLTALPGELQRDIRATWGSFKRARDEALVLLFSLGREAEVGRAIKSAEVGKRVGSELYVHVSAIDVLPPLLRLAEFAARKLVGEVEADIVKFSDLGRAVSFLRYPEFDTDPHPGLRSSLRVYLPRAKYDIREYGDANPFILHRKELFVAEDYPGRARFAALSQAEEGAGLLGRSDIGTRRAWTEVLESEGLHLAGHELMRGKESLTVGLVDEHRYHRPMETPTSAPHTPAGTAAQADLDTVLRAFGSLKVHRSGGQPSLKKPVLLMVVVARLHRGVESSNQIRFVALESEFKRALEAASGKRAGNLAEPFVRMATADFWSVRAPSDVKVGPTKRVLSRDDVWAELDASVYGLLANSSDAREQVLRTMLDRWVSAERREQLEATLNGK